MFATLSNYNNNAPRVFESVNGNNVKLLSVPSYGTSGYPSVLKNVVSSYATLGTGYNANTSNNTSKGYQTIQNAYQSVYSLAAPTRTMSESPYKARMDCERNELYQDN